MPPSPNHLKEKRKFPWANFVAGNGLLGVWMFINVPPTLRVNFLEESTNYKRSPRRQAIVHSERFCLADQLPSRVGSLELEP